MDAALRAVESVIATIGGKWKLLILFHLAQGERRYGELRRLMPAITEKMLIQQLRELESDDMVIRTVDPTVPPKVVYAMSARAKSFCPVMQALCEWGMMTNRASERLMPSEVVPDGIVTATGPVER
jgi:DNA-binding HxlR family transcriptional regulator